jgi:hypothetical protein
MATKIPGGKPRVREQREPLLSDGRGVANLDDEPVWPAQQQQDGGEGKPEADETPKTGWSSGRSPTKGGFVEKFKNF